MDIYRPVSLLTYFSKVFEKVTYLQLTNHFEINELFYNSQYGFKEDHSTESTSFELIERLITQINNKRNPVCIYICLYQRQSIQLVMIY